MGVQVLVASVSPNFAVLIKWPLHVMIQTVMKERATTQRQLNKIYEGPIIELSERYGAMLNVLFVIMMYASGLPILYLFGIIFFTTAYWCDKITLLQVFPLHLFPSTATIMTRTTWHCRSFSGLARLIPRWSDMQPTICSGRSTCTWRLRRGCSAGSMGKRSTFRWQTSWSQPHERRLCLVSASTSSPS